MRLWFMPQKEVILPPLPTKFCSCRQEVLATLYNRKYKAHRIGTVVQNGKDMTLFCDGKERNE